jgi:hypothetical protein
MLSTAFFNDSITNCRPVLKDMSSGALSESEESFGLADSVGDFTNFFGAVPDIL